MHELSLAANILETVLREIEENNFNSVETIGLQVGALSGVVPEALQFSFEAISRDTLLEKTKLEIEKISIKGKCYSCNKKFTVEKFLFLCPSCYSGQIEITQGEELDIAYIEVE